MAYTLPTTVDALMELADRVSNVGRWGERDQMGTANLIDAAAVLRGVHAVRSGRSFSLAIPLDERGPMTTGAAGRFNPHHYMIRSGGDALSGAMVAHYWGGKDPLIRSFDDVILMPLQAGTQWDGLAHISHGDRLYNGYPISSISSWGAEYLGIETVSNSLCSRAFLVDAPLMRGVEYLDAEDAIGYEDLDRWMRDHSLVAQPGDILLIRTGWLLKAKREGWGSYAGGAAPGLSLDCLLWLREHDIAAVAADTFSVEIRPFALPDVIVPFHLVALCYMGLFLGEIFDLDDLAADCQIDGQYEGFLAAAPLPVTGGIGSPINPMFFK